MGSYLSVPVREKISDDYIGKLSYGASSMQGWRSSQEDAHNCQVDFDTDTSLFAVYDGHGGSEVAIYTSKYLPEFIKSLSTYKNGKIETALEEAFIGFDATLVEEAVIKQLKDIAGLDLNEDDDEEEDVKNEAALLREEATMPIEKLIQRYKSGKAHNPSNTSHEKEDENVAEGAVNNSLELADDKITNGFHEENDSTSKPEVDQNGETPAESDKPEPSDKANVEPHCSKVAEDDEDDSEEEDDDSDDDKWNSEENDSDDEDDDDEELESFGLTKHFNTEEDEEQETMEFGETPGADSGCTAVVALLKGRDVYVANAGDSRCVVCRGQEAIDMSIDHKPEDDIEKNRIHKAGGKITADGRVNGGLNLSRAIGDHAYKRNTKLELKDQMISALPDIKHITLDKEDKFMVLACDGIWNVLTSQEVVDFILKRLDMGETKLSNICEELFEACLAPDTLGDGTGCDNMTCIIVKLPSNEDDAIQAETANQAKNSKRKRSEDAASVEVAAKRSRNESGDSNS